MGVQRALRLAGGAGGVDHHRRIVGGGVDRREIGRGARQQVGESSPAPSPAPSSDSTQAELRHLAANLVELGEALRVGDQRLGAGILQPVGQRIGPEQHRERQRDGAELVDRDMGGGDFRRLRQQDRDAVAARDAMRAQHIGEPVGGLAQPAIGDGVLAPVRPHMQDGEPAGLARRPAVADIDADIVARRHLPAELAIDVVVIVQARQHRHGGADASQSNARARSSRCSRYALLLVRLGQDQRPVHFVFRARRVDRRDAHAGRALEQHVGAVRRRIAPAGERLGQRVIAGADILGRRLGVVARRLQPRHERLAGVVVELVALGHDRGLRLGQPRQLGIERHRRQPVIGAVAGDHRGGGGGVELRARLRQIAIEARLCLRHICRRRSRRAPPAPASRRSERHHRRRSPNR